MQANIQSNVTYIQNKHSPMFKLIINNLLYDFKKQHKSTQEHHSLKTWAAQPMRVWLTWDWNFVRTVSIILANLIDLVKCWDWLLSWLVNTANISSLGSIFRKWEVAKKRQTSFKKWETGGRKYKIPTIKKNKLVVDLGGKTFS